RGQGRQRAEIAVRHRTPRDVTPHPPRGSSATRGAGGLGVRLSGGRIPGRPKKVNRSVGAVRAVSFRRGVGGLRPPSPPESATAWRTYKERHRPRDRRQSMSLATMSANPPRTLGAVTTGNHWHPFPKTRRPK